MSLVPQERITIPDEDGVEYEFEVLTVFDINQTGNSYVAVMPIEQLEDEETELFVFRYEEDAADEEKFKIFQIDADEEWDLVEETLNTLLDDGNNLI